MPEAPEVYQVVRYLKQQLENHQIVQANIAHARLIDNMPYEMFCEQIQGQQIRQFKRLGKYIVLELDDYTWISHLRMEGKFLIVANQDEFQKLDWTKDRKHIHAQFVLEDGRILCYKDTRKFGRMSLWLKQEDIHQLPPLQKVGKDVLDPTLCGKDLANKAVNRTIALKTFLLDQSVIAGIGNIYADEILFASKFSPFCLPCDLSVKDFQKIVEATQTIMKRAVEAGGTTILSFSYGANHSGSFQEQLQVHAQTGNCPICGHPIEHQKVNGRTTYFCAHCQKLKKKRKKK